MGSVIAAILKFILGRVFGLHKDPTPVDLADSNARAQERLGQQESANAIVDHASRARADAADRVVRVVADAPASADTGAVNAELKREFPSDFRD